MSLYAGYYPRSRSIRETLDLVGLADRSAARCGQLSGGQRRRLDAALALIGDPELLFLDEPTTGFDPSARRAAWDVISGLRDLGKTIFLTTHYMEEAEYLADRIAVIAKGKMVAEGTAFGIGERATKASTIRFNLPSGLSAADLRRRAGGGGRRHGRPGRGEDEQPPAAPGRPRCVGQRAASISPTWRSPGRPLRTSTLSLQSTTMTVAAPASSVPALLLTPRGCTRLTPTCAALSATSRASSSRSRSRSCFWRSSARCSSTKTSPWRVEGSTSRCIMCRGLSPMVSSRRRSRTWWRRSSVTERRASTSVDGRRRSQRAPSSPAERWLPACPHW